MRLLWGILIVFSLAVSGWSAVLAQSPAVQAERVGRASAIDPGFGAIVISIRSEIYLEEPLDVYFLREGGEVTNSGDVVRIGRKQDFFALGNSTVNYQVRAYQLPVGTYRLIGHGIDCPKIPDPDERCLIDRRGITGTIEVSRPSRGYGENALKFEVLEGAVTQIGDLALTSRNTLEWSAIPTKELSRVSRRFRRLREGPQPVIPEEFKLKYVLFPRSFQDDRGRRY